MLSAPAISDLSWLNPTPHAIAVYASQPLSPVVTQHSLPSGRLLLTWAGLTPAGSHQLCLAHSFDHLTGRRRWCGAVLPENVSRANLIDAHEPTVAADIGRQDRDEPAFDPTLPWYADDCRPLFCNADDGQKRTFCRETMLFWTPSAPLLGGSAELFILFFILLR